MLIYSEDLESRIEDIASDNALATAMLVPWSQNPDGPNFLALDPVDPTMMTFVANKRARQAEDGMLDPWSPRNRQSGKVGRIARQVIHTSFLGNITDKDVEQFTYLIGAAKVSGTWELVEGDDIRYWYDGDHYASRAGTLTHSCMRYKRCQSFFGLYTDNPNLVKLLILRRRGGIAGRALVWNHPDHGMLLDRAYGSDRTMAAFEAYGREQGWSIRDHNGVGGGTIRFRSPDGDHFTPEPITLAHHRFLAYPYMDTFAFYNPTKGTIQCFNDGTDADLVGLHDTDGNDRAVWRERSFRCHRCSSVVEYVGVDGRYPACPCERCPTCGAWRRPGARCQCRACADCGAVGRTYGVVVSSATRHICATCADNYDDCATCGRTVTRSESRRVGNETFCVACLQSRAAFTRAYQARTGNPSNCDCAFCREANRRFAMLVDELFGAEEGVSP